MLRRQFLATAAGSLALPLIACSRKTESGVPPGTLHDSGLEFGHRLRDRHPFPAATEDRSIDTLIVGAGIGGLSAGWWLQKKGYADFRIIELADRPGGNARFVDRSENPVSAHPLGAHYLPLPTREARYMRELLADLDALAGDPQAARPVYDERRLCHSPQERLYRDGFWQEGLIPQFGLPPAERAEIARFLEAMEGFRTARDVEGRRAFALPADLSSPDPRWRSLDRISMADWLRDEGFRAPALHWYVDYACRDDFGTTLADTSAWAGIHYFACRNGEAANAASESVLTAPEGNGWIVRALAERLTARLTTGSTVIEVRPGRPHEVQVWLAAEARTVRYRCRHLVWAAPLFLLPHLAPDLPAPLVAAARAASYAPWLVANLTLAEPPQVGAGAPLAWDNVPYGSTGLGYVVATHQNLRLADGPTVLTWYHALAHQPPESARQTLLGTSREQWAASILGELGRLHRNLPAATRRLDIFRHGHAMIRPTPGALWHGPRQAALAALPRGFHLAHADASGLSLCEESNYRGVMAAERILRS